MQMPADVVLTAFEVLMDFVGLYDYVKRDSKVCFYGTLGFFERENGKFNSW